MNTAARAAAVIAAVLLLGLAGWRITRGMLADSALAAGEVAQALHWQPEHPDAGLQQAERAIAAKRNGEAAGIARDLLRQAPVDGRGYRILAQVAHAEGRKDDARALFRIAARRAPRDVPSRAWLAQDALERGDYADALTQIDQVLTLSPGPGAGIYPVLVSLAADPDFADALATTLRRPPAWREGMLAAMRQASATDRSAADQVLNALQRKGGFTSAETTAWTESLLSNGRWGEAYARWAAPLVADGRPLPLLYNGNFDSEPMGHGFDWLMPPTPGVLLEFEPAGASGQILHARFLGRRMSGAFLEHRLLLSPGRYQFRLRQRLAALRSDHGLQWSLACADQAQGQLGASAPLAGSRDWTTAMFDVEVPGSDCRGQWLRLGNGGAAGGGQLVSGELWIDAVVIKNLAR